MGQCPLYKGLQFRAQTVPGPCQYIPRALLWGRMRPNEQELTPCVDIQRVSPWGLPGGGGPLEELGLGSKDSMQREPSVHEDGEPQSLLLMYVSTSPSPS